MQETILLHEFIDVKGWKAQGNKLISGKLVEVKQLEGEDEDGEEGEPGGALKTGDTIEFDVPHQKSIFDLDDEQDN